MKANRKIQLTHDTRAQVGIGTMIVFIATILVAATAAAVLIDTSGKLQERSSSTGNEATKQVASNLVLKHLYGSRIQGGTQDNIQSLNISVALAPGASQVDFAQVKIFLHEKTTRADISYDTSGTKNDCASGENDAFCVVERRDPKNTMALPDTAVLSAGGLVDLTVNLSAADQGNGMSLAPRKSVSLLIVPEIGSPLIADFRTPTAYGDDDIVVLR